MSESDDEPITLSADTLAALVEFNAEKTELTKKFDLLKTAAEDEMPLSMEAFTEDWNESQFWYADETADLFAAELLDGATAETTIGVVSAPSAFVALKNALRKKSEHERPKLVLLEHDDRFNVFKEFVFYDFAEPFKLPAELKGSIDRLIYDPPFLSDDCQTKAAMTVRWLLKPGATDTRVIACTGERMGALVTKLLGPLGVRTTTYEPRHARGLSNEFYCYANFESAHWTWRAA